MFTGQHCVVMFKLKQIGLLVCLNFKKITTTPSERLEIRVTFGLT